MSDRYRSIALVTLLLLPASPALAQLDAPAPPDDPASALFTLTDIYQRLAAGIPGARRGMGFVEPTSGPASSGFDLDDIMAVAPFPDEAAGATASQCLEGRRYWSLQPASWGAHTGTMPDVGAESLMPGTSAQTISLGYHDGLGEVAGDADLVPGNIRAGTEIFGVAGAPAVVDTSSGDAGAGEIASSRRAWVDGVEVIGTAALASRFIDNGDGTVTDDRNGLVWLKDASCAEIPRTDGDGRAVFADAVLGSAELADGLCGLTDGSSRGDWRLPRDYELWGLVDPRLRSPSLADAAGSGQWAEGDAFAGVVSSNYWTTTFPETCPPSTDCRNTVRFEDGVVVRALLVGDTVHYVWPVKR